MSIGKFIGCTMIVVGSAIGAGILLLPLQACGAGFGLSAIVILIAWGLLTLTGLLILETNLALPDHACSFSSMAEKTLGTPGKMITWISYLLLLYSTVTGYMAGESSMIPNLLEPILHFSLAPWLSTILFTFSLGIAVFWSTKAVDHLNRGLFSIKGLGLIAVLVLVLPHVDIIQLIANQKIEQAKYLFAATPALLVIFNYHFVIPSLRMYIGNKPRELKWIIVSGTTISLILYLLWIAAILGTIPLTGKHSFTSLSQLGHSAGPSDTIKIMIFIMQNKWITFSLNLFFNVAMTTSFLGVSLGLFDFLADGFKRPNTRFGRFQTSCLTFIPPLFIALFYPHGFSMAMTYSASFVAILCLIFPALMVYRLRKNPELPSTYHAPGGNMVFATITFIGTILFILPILTNLHLLPSIL